MQATGGFETFTRWNVRRQAHITDEPVRADVTGSLSSVFYLSQQRQTACQFIDQLPGTADTDAKVSHFLSATLAAFLYTPHRRYSSAQHLKNPPPPGPRIPAGRAAP